MRGQHSLFLDILPPLNISKATGIGRSKTLIEKRNTKLIYRYYWYVQHQPQRLDYSYIINELSNEFDLSDVRIIILLNDCHTQLKSILQQKPTIKELQRLYPFLSW